MSTLYWIITLGSLSEVIRCLTIFIGVMLIVFGVVLFIDDGYDDYKHLFKGAVLALVPLTVLSVFVPSKKDLFIIYGVGTTLDYLKENPKAKELPDKCIKVISNYFDDILKEDEK